MLGTPVRHPAAWTRPREAALGGDHELIRIGIERFRDQTLADLRTVGVGGIDEVDAQFEGSAQHTLALFAILRFAPDAGTGEAHGAKTESIDRQVTPDIDGSRECGRDGARGRICHGVLLAGCRLLSYSRRRSGYDATMKLGLT